jgi:ribosomal protein S18 acetylase RimI-like enzyme
LRADLVSLRPAAPEDQDLLYRIYASTRAEELTLVDWDEAQKEAFLRMQFAAQDRHYRHHFAGASFDVVVVDGEPAGRLYVDRRPDEMRIVDIALLPEFRRRGTGTLLLRALMAEAETEAKPLRIHVERFNPALRLYQRLGFSAVGDQGVYLLLEWRRKGQVNTAS